MELKKLGKRHTKAELLYIISVLFKENEELSRRLTHEQALRRIQELSDIAKEEGKDETTKG